MANELYDNPDWTQQRIADEVEAVIKDDPECLAKFREAMKEQKEESQNVCTANITRGGTVDYIKSRLKRDCPELLDTAAKVEVQVVRLFSKDLLVKHRPKGKRGPKPKDNCVNNINETPERAMGTSRLYIEERLQRDHKKT